MSLEAHFLAVAVVARCLNGITAATLGSTNTSLAETHPRRQPWQPPPDEPSC